MKKSIIIAVGLILLTSCKNLSRSDYPGADEIILEWEFRGNSGRSYPAAFYLENRSDRILGSTGWAIYYNQSGRDVVSESVTGKVSIDHINGDLVRISPMEGFRLEPGERAEISYNKPGRIFKIAEAPMGPYMVYIDPEGNETAAVPIEDYTIRPYPEMDRIFTNPASVPVPDASWIFQLNSKQELLDPAEIGKIIPTPVFEQSGEGTLTLGANLMVHYDGGLENEADYLAVMLEQLMGNRPAVMQSSVGHPNVIRLAYRKEELTGEEAYNLVISPENGVIVSGSTGAGIYYGIQSLLALVTVDSWKEPRAELSLSAVEVSDAPAFGYRGMHLDIARNFIGPAAIKKLIRVMAYYKLNTLHLHLTDDEGWRLEIPSLPELTEVGAFRGHTVDLTEHISPSYGSGPDPHPEAGHGSGYLSREVFIELLKFAADHHIEVIPEINFPGHARAAIYAMENRYERLMKEGKEEEALEYRLIDPDDASVYNSAQNFNDNVICVCREGPYRLFETVVEDIIEMYSDAGLNMSVLHTGGDEVPQGVWTESPICRNYLEAHPETGDPSNLQAYFGERILGILKEKNLVMAGWEEIAMKKNGEGRWIPNPGFMEEAILPYVWNSLGNNLDLGYRLANAGFPVVLCNVSNFYFDLAYNHHPEEPGQYWGGFVNTRRAFEFVPFDVYNSTMTDRYWRSLESDNDFNGLEGLNPDAVQNIVGLQGELWSEMIKGGEMLEYYYMPKLIGLAERAWVGQETWGGIEDDDERISAMDDAWNRFANVIGQREMPRLDYLFGGFNYRLPPPGIRIEDGMLHANIDFPGLTMRYTKDGSEPGINSPVYNGPVTATGKVMIRSFDTRGRSSRISQAEVD